MTRLPLPAVTFQQPLLQVHILYVCVGFAHTYPYARAGAMLTLQIVFICLRAAVCFHHYRIFLTIMDDFGNDRGETVAEGMEPCLKTAGCIVVCQYCGPVTTLPNLTFS